MILVIDNYDSFTYNLVQYLGELKARVEVVRNDVLSAAQALAWEPEGILISPGPGTPDDAGVSLELIASVPEELPVLGVCLGHQSIGQVFGGKVVRAERLMHGRTSMIEHDGCGVYRGVPSPFQATRYHSLIVERESLPELFEVSSWTDRGEVMGIRHRTRPIEGVQFHPESFLTEHGHRMLSNFLELLPDRGQRKARGAA